VANILLVTNYCLLKCSVYKDGGNYVSESNKCRIRNETRKL
jgi:hypothetical protein